MGSLVGKEFINIIIYDDDGYSKSYICKDKSMISYRGKKSTRKMTDEQREAARERMSELQAKKKDKINSVSSV